MGPPPFKNQNVEIGFVHAREDQKIGLGPNFHELGLLVAKNVNRNFDF